MHLQLESLAGTHNDSMDGAHANDTKFMRHLTRFALQPLSVWIGAALATALAMAVPANARAQGNGADAVITDDSSSQSLTASAFDMLRGAGIRPGIGGKYVNLRVTRDSDGRSAKLTNRPGGDYLLSFAVFSPDYIFHRFEWGPYTAVKLFFTYSPFTVDHQYGRNGPNQPTEPLPLGTEGSGEFISVSPTLVFVVPGITDAGGPLAGDVNLIFGAGLLFGRIRADGDAVFSDSDDVSTGADRAPFSFSESAAIGYHLYMESPYRERLVLGIESAGIEYDAQGFHGSISELRFYFAYNLNY